MSCWGKPYTEIFFRNGKKVVQKWIDHFPTRTLQSEEEHRRQRREENLAPDYSVLLDEKEVRE